VFSGSTIWRVAVFPVYALIIAGSISQTANSVKWQGFVTKVVSWRSCLGTDGKLRRPNFTVRILVPQSEGVYLNTPD
jgi:hypothetical protein